MKKLYVLLAFVILLSGCLSFKELPVEYDYSYSGRFKKYSTFDLMQQPTAAIDTTMYNPVIESSILARLKFLGYRQTTRKPNLLIAYKIYYDSLKFNGYEQPEIEDWAERPGIENDYNAKKIEMRSGTLLIQFYDRRQEKLIWNGYATSLYGPIQYSNNRQLRNAVISILDKYRFFADGYMDALEVGEKINQ
ncbi:MAG: DUF4136 domain-containing protein [Cyclobacteriaceae bacterium]|nr:DUF4136 domain-containing protein [Cyclobacteriaceae bacterium]